MAWPTCSDAVNEIASVLCAGDVPSLRVSVDGTTPPGPAPWLVLLRLNAGTAGSARILVYIDDEVPPNRAARVAARVAAEAERGGGGIVPAVAARFLPVRTRQILAAELVGCVDTCGTVSLSWAPYAVASAAVGEPRDPAPPTGCPELRSLAGAASLRAVRAVLDTPPPLSTSTVTRVAGVSLRTAERVLRYLEWSAAVRRDHRGVVVEVDREATLRTWALDYAQLSTNRPFLFCEPGGHGLFGEKLAAAPLTYAATGAFAAQYGPSILDPDRCAVYVPDAAAAAASLDLRAPDGDANVVLVEPFDAVAFEGTVVRGPLRCVAPSHLIVDLLTGPGCEPSQGEYLLELGRADGDRRGA